MGTFTPIAMICTQEQFDAVKPKLKSSIINDLDSFIYRPYLINNRDGIKNNITNYRYPNNEYFEIHEPWNEEIFLKACGIEVESLEQQLQKAEAEVKRLQSLIEEENKPKVGDWVCDTKRGSFYKKITQGVYSEQRKITNPELIKLLEQEIK